MKPFENIAIDYKVINKVAYPRLKILGMVLLPDITPPPSGYDSFKLYRFTIPRNNEELMNKIKDVIFYQSVLYYMNENIYMSAYMFLGDIDIGVPEVIDITNIFQESQYMIVDINTDLNNNMYVYRLYGYYKGKEYASEYIAGVMHFDIEEENITHIDPETTGGITPINFGLGSLFCSDDIYTIDPKQRIFVKGIPISNTNMRYRGPIDAECYRHKLDSIIQAIDFIKTTITTIENLCYNILDSVSQNSYLMDFYRRYE